MRYRDLHSSAIVVIVILALGLIIGHCSTNPDTKIVIAEKKIPIQVRIPSVVIDRRIDTVIVVHNKIDTAAISRLIAIRDSLRKELDRRSVGVLFNLDTITAHRDTISISCDEIRRRITASIRFGARDTTIVHYDTSFIAPVERSKWGVSAGLGASLSLDNSVVMLRPGAFIGITYSIFNF